MCLQFGFVMFRQKDFGAKAAHKMLVKLTPVLLAFKIFISTATEKCSGGSGTIAMVAPLTLAQKFTTLIVRI